jgi:hypothetical protein
MKGGGPRVVWPPLFLNEDHGLFKCANVAVARGPLNLLRCEVKQFSSTEEHVLAAEMGS